LIPKVEAGEHGHGNRGSRLASIWASAPGDRAWTLSHALLWPESKVEQLGDVF